MRRLILALTALTLATPGFASEQSLALEVEVTVWGIADPEDPEESSSFEVLVEGRSEPVEAGTPETVTLQVGTPYQLGFVGNNLDPGASFSFLAPEGYRAIISGVPKSREFFTTAVVDEDRTLMIVPKSESLPAGAFDYE